MLRHVWMLLRDTVNSFLDDGALSRGAAIAFYTVTSLAPVLLIVIAIAGLAFGRQAAQDSLTGELSGLMGQESAHLLQGAIASADGKFSGLVASLIGIGTMLIAASGIFGEMQAALNVIWKAEPQGTSLSRLIQSRMISLALVAVLGLLLISSLVVSTLLTAFSPYLTDRLPAASFILELVNLVVSVVLLSIVFAAIYKILPDRHLEWQDVIVGAIATSVLFNIGKSLIGWFIGSSATASSYGAAGALLVILLWIYYFAQIFLLGAEFTKIYAERHGSQRPDSPSS